jgi:hypothetical protein
MAAVAENEARVISERTTAALAAYRDGKRLSKRIRLLYPDGVPPDVVEATAGRLGASLPQCRNLTPKARAKGTAMSVASRRAAAIAAVRDLAPRMLAMWKDDRLSLQAIADRLNAEEQTTRTGNPWSPIAVKRVLDRVEPERQR